MLVKISFLDRKTGSKLLDVSCRQGLSTFYIYYWPVSSFVFVKFCTQVVERHTMPQGCSMMHFDAFCSTVALALVMLLVIPDCFQIMTGHAMPGLAIQPLAIGAEVVHNIILPLTEPYKLSYAEAVGLVY